LFSGRLPYLWFAYIDYISGTDYFNIDIKPNDVLPLTDNLSDLTSLQPGIAEVNLLDPDFKYPRDWKSNLEVNWKHNNKWTFGFDFSFTKVVQGLLFKSINRNEIFANLSGADNRLFYNTTGDQVKIDENFTNVFLLTNTNKGFRYNATINVERKTDRSRFYAGYSYGLSKDISSTVRSSPAANYEWNQAILGNDPELSFSNYDLRHKLNISYATVIPIRSSQLSISLLYNGRSGSPYSIVYQGDLNNDGSSRNDLAYIPSNASEIELARRGTVVERNAAKTPWNHSLDGSFSFSFPYLEDKKATIRFDLFNLFNFVNSKWGKQFFVPNVVNSSFSLLKFEGLKDGNVPTFSFNVPADQKPWLIDSISSRWRMQFGLEIEF